MILNIRPSANKLYNNNKIMTTLSPEWLYSVYDTSMSSVVSSFVSIELTVKTHIYRQLVFWRVYKWL